MIFTIISLQHLKVYFTNIEVCMSWSTFAAQIFLDPRAEALLFVGVSPLPLITILTAFALLCKFGPIIMESRRPFELKSLMTFYNFTQVVLNTFLGCKVSHSKFYCAKNHCDDSIIFLGGLYIILEIQVQL